MPENKNIKTENQQPASPWYQAAVGSAVVSGAFAIIVLILLIVNYLQIKVLDPAREEKLEILQLKVSEQPGDQALISKIRQADLRFRNDKFKRLHFSHKAGLMLLGSVIIFLIAVKFAVSCREKLPMPEVAGNKNFHVRESAMNRTALTVGLVVIVFISIFLISTGQLNFQQRTLDIPAPYPSLEQTNKNWHRFRGPGGLGISAYKNIPTQWDGRSGQGILWKTPVPLAGHNSPIVWENRVFISGSDGNKQEIYCFDSESGNILWQGDVPHVAVGSSGKLKLDEETGYAASTMATDGRRVYAIFATGDVAAFDFNGNKAWNISVGIPDSTYGYATSLDMFRNLLFIQYDQGSAEESKSKLFALDASSSRTVWVANRSVPGSWTSPITAKTPDGFQLITCADPWVIAYDPNTGRELWRVDCLGSDPAPSPIYAGGFVFAVESSIELIAIKPDGTGDVTKTHIAWKAEDGIPDITSPVSNGSLIWLLDSGGILTCYQVSDGSKIWEQDIGMSFQASPSLVGDSLYLLSEKGVMIIVEAGREFRELARAELGERCYASPAFADGLIYIRGINNLYCIGTNGR